MGGRVDILIQFEFQIQAVWSFLFLRSRPCPRLSKSPLLFFFLVGYGTTFTGRKFAHWCHDNWPKGQWWIFHAAPDTPYVNHFFPAWIYNMIRIRSRDTNRPRDFVTCRSLRDLMHWNSIAHFNELIRGRLVASLALSVFNLSLWNLLPFHLVLFHYFKAR